MRKISLVVLSIGALFALSLYWQGPATAQDLQMQEAAGPVYPGGDTDTCWWSWGFGKKVAGSYLIVFPFPPDNPDPTTGQLTINVDGTYTVFSEAAFGRNNPPESRWRSAIHGAWERTGQYTIKMRGFIYAHDDLTGATAWIARQNPVAEFDEEYEGFTGDISTGIFLRDQLFDPDDGFAPNPNTEDDPVSGPWPGYWEGTRIHVAE